MLIIGQPGAWDASQKGTEKKEIDATQTLP